MKKLNNSEYNTNPSAIIIHNPIKTFNFKKFYEVGSSIELYEDMLFRGKPNIGLFTEQYEYFKKALTDNIENVIELDSITDNETKALYTNNPNQIYTRDSMVTLPWESNTSILCNLGKEIRKPEREVIKKVNEYLSIDNIISLPEKLILEGGDVIPIVIDGKKTLLIGYGPRTSLNTIKYLQKNFIPNLADCIIAIELGDWRINLDGGMVPVSNNLIISHTKSILSSHVFTKNTIKEINFINHMKDFGFNFIDVTYDESKYKQACNCFCFGNGKIIQYDMTPHISDQVEEYGVEVIKIPGNELVLGTGGPRCMTRPIY